MAAVLVLLAVIPVLIAQSSRRPLAGLQEATRALIEGRYDEVAALTEKLDPQDPNVAAVKARALIARGRYQEAEAVLRPIAQRAPTSEAALELGLLLQMLGKPDATAILSRVAAAAGRATDAAELAAGGRALRALGRFQEANAAYRDAASLAPRDPAINTAWGELFLEKYNRRRSAEVVPGGAPGRSALRAGAARLGARARRRQSAAGGRLAKQALEINPSDVDAHVFLAGEAADAGHARRGARSCSQKALAINPSSLEAQRSLAALAYVEDKTAGVRGGGRQGARDRAQRTARSTASPASSPRTTTGSTRRSR